jgi:hypothetical protein
VKTGTDTQAAQVSRAPIPASVAAMNLLPIPAGGPDSRHGIVERSTFAIEATLDGFQKEPDGDIHLGLRQGASRMIVEIPNPGCVPTSSPFHNGVKQSRARFLAAFPNGERSTTWVDVNRTVLVTGVGFFDFRHNQQGAALNGVELHPVLSFTVLDK